MCLCTLKGLAVFEGIEYVEMKAAERQQCAHFDGASAAALIPCATFETRHISPTVAV